MVARPSVGCGSRSRVARNKGQPRLWENAVAGVLEGLVSGAESISTSDSQRRSSRPAVAFHRPVRHSPSAQNHTDLRGPAKLLGGCFGSHLVFLKICPCALSKQSQHLP